MYNETIVWVSHLRNFAASVFLLLVLEDLQDCYLAILKHQEAGKKIATA